MQAQGKNALSRRPGPWTGALKMLDVKMTDVKLTDQFAGHENAGHEIEGPMCRA